MVKNKIVVPISGGIEMNNRNSPEEYSSSRYPIDLFIAFDQKHYLLKAAIETNFMSTISTEARLTKARSEYRYGEYDFKCYFRDLNAYSNFLNTVTKEFSFVTKDDYRLDLGQPLNLPKEYLLSETKQLINTHNLGL